MRTANPNKKKMYKCRRVRRRRDRFSELPDGLLDKILGCMPIVDAARLAVLSTLWRDTWFSLTTLDFDMDFFDHIRDKYNRYYCSDRRTRKLIYDNHNIDTLVSESLYIINKIVMHHSGPVRKFRFLFGCCDFGSLKSRMFDIYQWLMFVTQKGVDEIHLKMDEDDGFMLPNCIFSCPTLRRLRIHGASYDTVDAPRNLLNLTSLCFEDVDFEPSGHAINAPMLENLSFYSCNETMFHFNITAPKLGKLTMEGCSYHQTNGYLPVNYSSWESVHTLVLDGYSIMNFFACFTRRGLPLQPPQLLNVEYLMLLDDPLEFDIYGYYSEIGDISPTFIHLLELCPKLCKLHMDVLIIEMLGDCLGTRTELSEYLYRVARKHNLLHTMILSDVPYRSEIETWLSGIKGLLACFPTLEKLVIRKQFNLKSIKKILHFPCASPNIEIFFI